MFLNCRVVTTLVRNFAFFSTCSESKWLFLHFPTIILLPVSEDATKSPWNDVGCNKFLVARILCSSAILQEHVQGFFVVSRCYKDSVVGYGKQTLLPPLAGTG